MFNYLYTSYTKLKHNNNNRSTEHKMVKKNISKFQIVDFIIPTINNNKIPINVFKRVNINCLLLITINFYRYL